MPYEIGRGLLSDGTMKRLQIDGMGAAGFEPCDLSRVKRLPATVAIARMPVFVGLGAGEFVLGSRLNPALPGAFGPTIGPTTPGRRSVSRPAGAQPDDIGVGRGRP